MFRVKGPFGVGASVELFQNPRDAVYSASIPHPFFFDRFRQFSGAESGLTSQETAAHLDAFVTKTWGPISIDVFGGPSWFFTKTELLAPNEDRPDLFFVNQGGGDFRRRLLRKA